MEGNQIKVLDNFTATWGNSWKKTQGTYKLPIIHDKKVKKNALV